MSLPRHNPPGNVNDFTESTKKAWSEEISGYMADGTDAVQFYDATKTKEASPAQKAPINWTGFPRRMQIKYPGRQRYEQADKTRNVQDEYLEWSVKRNESRKITKIVFCNEGPEYWETLGKHQPDDLYKLVQKLHPDVKIERDKLFKNGEYDPHNVYNNSTTTGTILHLIQPANTLGAEIELAKAATVIRKDGGGNLVTDPDRLIRCSQYGNPDRFSDPTIGAQVNDIARGGAMITIDDPVGLYIVSVDLSSVEVPDDDDADPNDFWKWERGSGPGYYMRATFEVPAGKKYVLGDLTVGGEKLNYGSQIADFIKIGLYGRAWGEGHAAAPQPCLPSQKQAAPALKVATSGRQSHSRFTAD